MLTSQGVTSHLTALKPVFLITDALKSGAPLHDLQDLNHVCLVGSARYSSWAYVPGGIPMTRLLHIIS